MNGMPDVVVILPVYKPNMEFLKVQIESIVNQTYKNWECLLIIDGHHEFSDEFIEQLDSRFKVVCGNRLGVYGNIERALQYSLTYADYKYYLFCDQDDKWDSNKIKIQVEHMNNNIETQILHHDLYEINQFDEITSQSVWTKELRSKNHSLFQLISRNSVTGCTMAVKRETIEKSIPFPKQTNRTDWHHDLWIALVASATNKKTIAAIDGQLVGYRQHGNNVVGSIDGVYCPSSLKYAVVDFRIRKALIGEISRRNSTAKFTTKFRLRIASTNLLSLVFLALSVKAVMKKEADLKLKILLTLGGIASLFDAVRNRIRQLGANLRIWVFWMGKKFALKFLKPANIAENIKPINILDNFIYSASDLNKTRLLAFLPSLMEQSLFGGANTLIKLAGKVANEDVEVIFFSADQKISANTKELETTIRTLANIKIEAKIKFHNERDIFNFNKNDIFLASAWWNAHSVQTLLSNTNASNRFIYLIQDFEPAFYPWSDNFASALQTYRSQHEAIYNTKILADFFEAENVSLTSGKWIIKPQFITCSGEQKSRDPSPLKILFYSRPSVARNLFNTGLEALRRFAKHLEALKIDTEFYFVGEKIQLSHINNFKVFSFGKLSNTEYQNLMHSCHIGMSLMLSPHPSYPPLEFVSHGLFTVTNSYLNKDKRVMPQDLILAEPNSFDLCDALIEALDRQQSQTKRPSLSHDFFEGFDLETLASEILKNQKLV